MKITPEIAALIAKEANNVTAILVTALKTLMAICAAFEDASSPFIDTAAPSAPTTIFLALSEAFAITAFVCSCVILKLDTSCPALIAA